MVINVANSLRFKLEKNFLGKNRFSDNTSSTSNRGTNTFLNQITPRWTQPVGTVIAGCSVGCTVTGWAIILAYWRQWRGRDLLFHSNDVWDKWDERDQGFLLDEQPKSNWMSTELTEIAVALETEYMTYNDGSCQGVTHPWNVKQIGQYLQNHGYGSTVGTYNQDTDYTYYDVIKAEVQNERPVLLWVNTGFLEGHSIVAVGSYLETMTTPDSISFFVNWGHGGGNDRWISVMGAGPGEDTNVLAIYTLNIPCSAEQYDCGYKCANISAECDDVTFNDIWVEKHDGPEKDGIFTKKSKGTITLPNSSYFIVEKQEDNGRPAVTLVAEEKITLKPGFDDLGVWVKKGGSFHAYIDEVQCDPNKFECGSNCCYDTTEFCCGTNLCCPNGTVCCALGDKCCSGKCCYGTDGLGHITRTNCCPTGNCCGGTTCCSSPLSICCYKAGEPSSAFCAATEGDCLIRKGK